MRTAVKRLYEFGPFRLDTYRGVLLREGEIVDVTPKVVDLLQVLVENNGQIVPREELLSEVWPDAVVDEANINRTVSMLRRALAEAGIDCVETIPKRGYRFTGEVREIDPGTVTVDRVTRAEVTIKEESESRWLWILGVVALVVTLAVGAIYQFSRRTATAPTYPLRLTNNRASDDLPSWSPDGSRIAFTSNREGKSAIYVMHRDGSGVKRLTQSADDSGAKWSPDGSRMAFTSRRDGNDEIYVMNADGTDQRNLTPGDGIDGFSPVWSPDGSRIAFCSLRDGKKHLFMIDPNGSNQIRMTSGAANDFWPAWSPDGEQLVFESDRDGNSEIYVINVDEVTRLTDDVADDVDPAWSPSGSAIAFASRRNGDFEIYVMNADGSSLRRLTQAHGDDIDPAWSHDGRRIAFTSSRDGRKQIYVMNADGSGAHRLTNVSEGGSLPSWSPDGRTIAFTRNADLYVMQSDGTGSHQLTHTSESSGASWSPDGKQIVFRSNRDAHFQLFVVDAAGKETRKLTQDPPGYVGPPWHDSSEPSWSPDGKKIAFRKVVDDLGNNMKIFIMDADSTHPRRITHNPAVDRNPTWSPDGRRIAFQSNRSGNFDMYVVNVR